MLDTWNFCERQLCLLQSEGTNLLPQVHLLAAALARQHDVVGAPILARQAAAGSSSSSGCAGCALLVSQCC
jgi:hypothetical protein